MLDVTCVAMEYAIIDYRVLILFLLLFFGGLLLPLKVIDY